MIEWEFLEGIEFSDIDFNFDQEDFLEDQTLNSDSIEKPSKKKIYKKEYKRTELGKLKRNMRRRVNFVPRIIKKDARRTYALMFSNVVNTLDSDLMMKYLSTYCIPSIKLVKFTFPKTPGKEEFLPGMIRYGLEDVHRFYTQSPTHYPDYVYRLQNSKIVPDLLDATSRIIIRMQISFSVFQNQLMCYSCGFRHNPSALCSETFNMNDKPSIIMSSIPSSGSMTQKKYNSDWSTLTIDGFHILHLDGDNHIVSFELCPISITSTPISL